MPQSVRPTGRGSLLVTFPAENQVVEIDRSTRNRIRRIGGLTHPFDAVPLRNGNVLAADYGSNRFVEMDAEGKIVWEGPHPNPTSAEELENGHLLLGSYSQGLIEIDARDEKAAPLWKTQVESVRAWRFQRLPSGRTLMVDNQSEQVLEVGRSGKNVVWKKSGLAGSCGAYRLDSGNTLILERDTRRIVEVDPLGREVREIKGLNYPAGMTVIP